MIARLIAAAVVASLGLPSTGHAAMTKAEYGAEKERIAGEFEAAKRKCESFGGNARNICLAEARGSYQVAAADLTERRTPSSRTRYKLRVAMAEARFDVAAEECHEHASSATDACLAEARAALARDKADARGIRNRRSPGERRGINRTEITSCSSWRCSSPWYH